MTESVLGGASAFLQSAVRTATPLALAALGETIAERAGVINLGLEGVMVAGALAGFAGAQRAGPLGGFVGGAVAGLLVAAIFAAFVVWLRTDQIIAGTAVTLLALGTTGTLYRAFYGTTGAAITVPTADRIPLPVLYRLPIVGEAFFDQPAVTYVVYLAVPLSWWWLYRTHAGLALRAVGERPAAAAAAGIATSRVRLVAMLIGGVFGGVAGATLVVAQAGTFIEGMSAGRGFVAIAIVVLGRWHVVGVAVAALVFGAASALQYLAQALGLAVPYQAFLALPYVLTLAALAGVAGRVRTPAALGRQSDDELP